MSASVVQLLDGMREKLRNDELPDHRTVEGVAAQLESAGEELAECALNCLAAAGGLRAAAGKANGRLQSLTKVHAEHLRQHVGNDVVIARSKVSQLRWAKAKLVSVSGESAVVKHDEAYWETPIEQIIIARDDVPSLPEATPIAPPSIEPIAAAPEPRPEAPTEAAFFAQVGNGELSNVLQYLTFTEHAGRLHVDPGEGHEPGHVFIDSHRVVHAHFDGQDGLPALALLLSLEDGEARFYTSEYARKETLRLPTDQLMLEAAVLADELAQGAVS